MRAPRGTPVWFELNTEDVEGARRFYAEVAGWQIAPSPVAAHGGYLVAAAPDGAGVAGMMAPQGLPGWAIYFASEDVDADITRAAELGAVLRFGPMDIPEVGRFAALTDPQGVPLLLMTTAGGDAPRAFLPSEPGSDASVGHGVWIELAAPDPDGAFAFYGALFGWEKAGAMPMGAMGEYAFIGAGEARPGAVMSSTMTGAPAGWSWYVHVADIDAAVRAATGAGGVLRQGPDEIPGGSFSAKITDAAGHAIGLLGPRR